MIQTSQPQNFNLINSWKDFNIQNLPKISFLLIDLFSRCKKLLKLLVHHVV